VKHQSYVGAGYFDEVTKAISGGLTATVAIEGSTEQEQFLQPVAEALAAATSAIGVK
jgi:hypothetical protein